MSELTNLIDVIDDASDQSYQALAALYNMGTGGEKIDWREIKRKRTDFSKSTWKPKIAIVKGDKFPYHAYAYRASDGKLEHNGKYLNITDAKVNAVDMALLLEED